MEHNISNGLAFLKQPVRTYVSIPAPAHTSFYYQNHNSDIYISLSLN